MKQKQQEGFDKLLPPLWHHPRQAGTFRPVVFSQRVLDMRVHPGTGTLRKPLFTSPGRRLGLRQMETSKEVGLQDSWCFLNSFYCLMTISKGQGPSAQFLSPPLKHTRIGVQMATAVWMPLTHLMLSLPGDTSEQDAGPLMTCWRLGMKFKEEITDRLSYRSVFIYWLWAERLFFKADTAVYKCIIEQQQQKWLGEMFFHLENWPEWLFVFWRWLLTRFSVQKNDGYS